MFLYGCPDPPTYPEYPIVEFDSFYADGEVGFLTVGFTDGDGDIGERDDITKDNLLVEYWEYNDVAGEWQQGTVQGEPFVFQFKLPYLTPNGKNKALKGTIEVEIGPNYRMLGSPYNDSIRYRIQMIDRSNNKSEWVFSPPIHNGVVVQ